jgi:hypothetical protein
MYVFAVAVGVSPPLTDADPPVHSASPVIVIVFPNTGMRVDSLLEPGIEFVFGPRQCLQMQLFRRLYGHIL